MHRTETVSIEALAANPDGYGFRFIPCDKCGGAMYAEGHDPKQCFGCQPSSEPQVKQTDGGGNV